MKKILVPTDFSENAVSAFIYAMELAERVGDELQIPIYLYESAQQDKSRSNLAVIRAGEYEKMASKIESKKLPPDFGPHLMNFNSGCTAIGARGFWYGQIIGVTVSALVLALRLRHMLKENQRDQSHQQPA